MLIRRTLGIAALVACSILQAKAATLYVNGTGSNPVAPYSDWSTAATNIQDAVSAANPGDQILVSNGVYNTGGTPSSDGTTNIVAVTNAVLLESANGPSVTSIDGGGVMRCVYLTNGAALEGFTITNGTAVNGGGVYCASTNALIENCALINNTATSGGGAYSGTISNCTLTGNACPLTGGNGGGATSAILFNCNLSGNVTGRPYPNSTGASWGGGANGCALNNCALTGNSAYGAGSHGGGASSPELAASGSILNNCALEGNYTDDQGGGAYGSTLNNCLLTGNSAVLGGGAAEGTLNNCTIVFNSSAGNGGGGTYYLTANNCIVVSNITPNNLDCALNYCCTPDSGVGCINYAPLFVDAYGGDFHLQDDSPCVNAGNNSYVTTTNDLDGNPRIVGGTVDIGAYENQDATAASGLPGIPTGLNASVQGGSIALNWRASSKAVAYNVYRATSASGPFTLIASGLAVTNYADTPITYGNTEFYYVTATNPYGESVGSAQAVVYVVDHFAFAPIPSPQTSSVPFTVTISACDSNGNVLYNFNGAAALSAAGDHGNIPLTPSGTSAFSSGEWSGQVTLSSGYPDTNIRLSANSNSVSGESNPFDSVAPAIQLFSLTAADMVYDPFAQLIYATIPASGGAYSNCLIAIDPIVGRVANSYYLGNDPNSLAVSSDGQYLYIGYNGTNIYSRFNLKSGATDLQVQLGGATEVASLPGLPQSVAVTGGGIAIFDDGVQRSNTYPLGSFVVPGSANELFTMGGGYPSAPFTKLTLNASGVASSTTEDGIVGVNEAVKYQGGLIFTSGGTVFSPDTLNVLGHLTNCSIVEPDLPAGVIFSMGYHPVFAQPDAWVIYVWNAATLQMSTNLPVPGVLNSPSIFIRWGTNGLAFCAANQLFLIRSSLVPITPPAANGGALGLSGQFQVNFTGDQAVPYSIWATTNLINWTQIGSPNLVSNGSFWYLDTNSTNYRRRFYSVGVAQ